MERSPTKVSGWGHGLLTTVICVQYSCHPLIGSLLRARCTFFICVNVSKCRKLVKFYTAASGSLLQLESIIVEPHCRYQLMTSRPLRFAKIILGVGNKTTSIPSPHSVIVRDTIVASILYEGEKTSSRRPKTSKLLQREKLYNRQYWTIEQRTLFQTVEEEESHRCNDWVPGLILWV